LADDLHSARIVLIRIPQNYGIFPVAFVCVTDMVQASNDMGIQIETVGASSRFCNSCLRRDVIVTKAKSCARVTAE
jgi:hypothetical protein